MTHIILLIIVIIISGCGSDGSSRIDQKNVLVIGDSVCVGTEDNHSWPDRLQDIASYNVSSVCYGGITLAEYDVQSVLSDYASSTSTVVLALGINDIYQGYSVESIMTKYDEAIHTIMAEGLTPICFLYAENGYQTSELNLAIEYKCASYGLSRIKSSTNISDYIHLTDSGRQETANNAMKGIN